jgi:flagellar basal-body rod protein FlgF
MITAGGVRGEECAMIYGLYLSGQGAQAQSDRLGVLANNLANASTGGFKRDLALFQAHEPRDVGDGVDNNVPGNLNEMTGGVTLSEVVTDFSEGPLTQTGGTYDLALVGEGFFTVSDGRETFLTRNGQLSVNAQGELVTADSGHAVLGVGDAPIRIPTDANEINIGADGSIFSVSADGAAEQVANINIVRPASLDDLEKVGNSLYRSSGSVTAAQDGVQVLQGHVEESGVRPVLEMMDLIEASRAFETNINMMRLQDESLGQLLQSVQQR